MISFPIDILSYSQHNMFFDEAAICRHRYDGQNLVEMLGTRLGLGTLRWAKCKNGRCLKEERGVNIFYVRRNQKIF